MGVLDNHEMNVKHHPRTSVYRDGGVGVAFTLEEQPGLYGLQFKASLTVPEEDFDSERYRKRFVEVMEAIARLNGRQE